MNRPTPTPVSPAVLRFAFLVLLAAACGGSSTPPCPEVAGKAYVFVYPSVSKACVQTDPLVLEHDGGTAGWIQQGAWAQDGCTVSIDSRPGVRVINATAESDGGLTGTLTDHAFDASCTGATVYGAAP